MKKWHHQVKRPNQIRKRNRRMKRRLFISILFWSSIRHNIISTQSLQQQIHLVVIVVVTQTYTNNPKNISILFPIKSFGRDMVHWALSQFISEPHDIIKVHQSWTFGHSSHKHVTYPTETPHLRHSCQNPR